MYFLIRSMCEMTSVLRVMKFIDELLKIVLFIIPMILIIMVMIDLSKAVLARDESEMTKAKNLTIRRLIMAMVLFLVPTLVNSGLSLLEGASTSVLDNYNTCIENMENIKFYEELEKVLKEQEESEIQQRIEAYQQNIIKNITSYTLIAYGHQDSSNVGVDGIVHGQTYNLTESQITYLAGKAIAEQGSSTEGVAAELSLMANLYELKGKKYKNIADYVKNGGWFSSGTRKATKNAKATVKIVLEKGNRTLPLYIDEHDCWNCNKKKYCSSGIKGDICSLQINGTKNTSLSGIKNKNNYVRDKTIIKNVYGSTYTFYTFPTENSDPFGYTAASYKKIKG